MKFPAKIFAVLLSLLLIVIIGLMWFFMLSDQEIPALKKAAPADQFEELLTPVAAPELLQRCSGEIAPEPSTAASANDLSAMLSNAAIEIVLSLLPESSRIVKCDPVVLTGSNRARVSGTVLIIANKDRKEQRLKFTTQVNFVDNIGCEAEYPHFSHD